MMVLGQENEGKMVRYSRLEFTSLSLQTRVRGNARNRFHTMDSDVFSRMTLMGVTSARFHSWRLVEAYVCPVKM